MKLPSFRRKNDDEPDPAAQQQVETLKQILAARRPAEMQERTLQDFLRVGNRDVGIEEKKPQPNPAPLTRPLPAAFEVEQLQSAIAASPSMSDEELRELSLEELLSMMGLESPDEASGEPTDIEPKTDVSDVAG